LQPTYQLLRVHPISESHEAGLYSISGIQSQWRWWIGERPQRLLHGEKKLWRMCNGYVVDLIVIELRIAMRENVAEPYDVSGVRNRFRNGGRHSVEVAHSLTADFQHAFPPPLWFSRPPGTALD
jgi:hypothetical protein